MLETKHVSFLLKHYNNIGKLHVSTGRCLSHYHIDLTIRNHLFVVVYIPWVNQGRQNQQVKFVGDVLTLLLQLIDAGRIFEIVSTNWAIVRKKTKKTKTKNLLS